MPLTPFEDSVIRYFDGTVEDRSWEAWDPEHLHYGLFDPARLAEYAADPHRIVADRAAAIGAMTSRILAPAALQPGERMVDAGCGVGGTALAAAALGLRVTGVNFNGAQLTEARAKAAERGLSAVCDFQWANCSEELPFPSASVDIVVNIESACHYRDRGRFFDEVARILKPGGRVAASDWVAKDHPTETEHRDLADFCRAWYLAPPLETPSSYQDAWRSRGFQVETSWLGDEARPNGLLADFRWRSVRSVPDFFLTDLQKERAEQMRTFGKTMLEGSMGLLVYSAIKPA